jgi:hypothetical protein
MIQLARILKRVYKLNIWMNPDGTFGADVEFMRSTEAVTFEHGTLEWLLDEINKTWEK